MEREYGLKRLVRGLGAATLASKAGFYTTLVAFLRETPKGEYPTAADVFALMRKQLNVGESVDSKVCPEA